MPRRSLAYENVWTHLERLAVSRESDEYADEYPSRRTSPEPIKSGIVTLDPTKVRRCTPMLRARFAFCGQWRNPFLGITWYSLSEMERAVRSSDVNRTVDNLREHWDNSIPTRLDNSRLSIIYRELGEVILFAWPVAGREPYVYWYTDQQELVFENLLEYLRYGLGECLPRIQ